MSITWDGEKYLKNLEADLGNNLEKAAIFLKGKVKEALNRSEEYQRFVGDHGIWYKGEDPSSPGSPPKKITGALQRSIAHEMGPDRKEAFVGSNVEYALYLELGTSKMAARPFLRSTLMKERDAIARIIATGKA
jgi:HK97 gp10 family phage protein